MCTNVKLKRHVKVAHSDIICSCMEFYVGSTNCLNLPDLYDILTLSSY